MERTSSLKAVTWGACAFGAALSLLLLLYAWIV